MTDDREVQIVEFPIVLHQQRACLPYDRKSVVALAHADEVYPMRRMNGIEIYRKTSGKILLPDISSIKAARSLIGGYRSS